MSITRIYSSETNLLNNIKPGVPSVQPAKTVEVSKSSKKYRVGRFYQTDNKNSYFTCHFFSNCKSNYNLVHSRFAPV